MNKILKYILTGLAISLSAIIILTVLVSLLIQTKPAKRMIASVAGEQSSRFINGRLSIGSIDGNFFSSLILKNIILTYRQDTVANIKELNISYNLWSLADNKIEVHSLNIDEPYLFLQQDEDSVWNFSKLFKSEQQEQTEGEPAGIEIEMPVITINEGSIITNAIDSFIPEQIKDFSTKISLNWSPSSKSAQLKELSFSTEKPGLKLEQLKFGVKLESDYFFLSDFYLKTSKNQLQGKAQLETKNMDPGLMEFQSPGIELSEFEYFLPDLKIPATPVTDIKGELENGLLKLNISLVDKNQKIVVNIASDNVTEIFAGKNTENISYNITGKFVNVDLAHWTGNNQLDYVINGELSAKGKGINPETAGIQLEGNLKNSVIAGEKLDTLLFEFGLSNNTLKGFLEGYTNFGDLWMNAEIKNITNHPSYSAVLNIKNLDLASLSGNDTLSSDINLSAKIEGKEFNPEILKADADITLSGSSVTGIDINTFKSNISYENEDVKIDTLLIETDMLRLIANGNYSFNTISAIKIFAEFSGLEEFEQFIPLDGITSSGKIDAVISGVPDSLLIWSAVELNKNRFNELTLNKLNIEAELNINKKDTLISTHIQAGELKAGEFTADSIVAIISGNTDSLLINANIVSELVSTQIQSGLTYYSENLAITIRDWIIEYNGNTWALDESPAVIEIDSTDYFIDNLKLISKVNDTLQYILLHGNISRKGEENFKIELA
ncbi:MAG: hypothetical protein PHH93_12145, partial [Prolixibacteraceae bacterium]|nr:hypothetical protein [Prolixibacteraceae bacterium]